MSFDFSLRRKTYRGTVRTLRMIAALGRAGWKAMVKLKKRREKAEVTEYDKWLSSTSKENIFIKFKLDPNAPPVKIGDLRFDLNA